MLSQEDIAWIKSNRSEIKAGRTEPITLIILDETGRDPYTDEPIQTEIRSTVDAIWKELNTVGEERSVIGGVELQKDDVQVTFDADVDLSAVTTLERKGKSYTLVAVDEMGIGEVNRQVCLVRKVY